MTNYNRRILFYIERVYFLKKYDILINIGVMRKRQGGHEVDKDTVYMHEVANGYRPDVEKLIRYIPWLESKKGARIASMYRGEGIEQNSIPFPVFDSAMISLVKDARKTALLDRNYAYVYSRNRIKSAADEQRLIASATIKDMNLLKGILSKYILGGATKAGLWAEGVENGSILKVLLKMKEILEYWDKPMEQRGILPDSGLE